MAGIESPFVKVRRKMVMARIEFMSQLAAFQPTDLTRLLTENGESPLLIAHHLSLTEKLARQQMQRIQEEEHPQLDLIIQLLPVIHNVPEPMLTLEFVLAEMTATRDELFTYLAGIPLASWERPFILANRESRKFYQFINMLPLHDRQHARQLATLKFHLDQ